MMVQIAAVADQNPSLREESSGARGFGETYPRPGSRMSIEGNNSEEEDAGFRERSSSDTKTCSSSEMSVQTRRTDSASPKSEGFASSPMSTYGDDNQSINRVRAVLDLSMASAYARKPGQPERRPSFSNALVPPYSPLSSSAGSHSSSSSGSPSVTPEVKLDEVSIHYIAAMAKDSAHRVPQPTNASEFDLPKNFYGYYVYQMELASRYNNAKNAAGSSGTGSGRNTTPPLVGKVKPTMKTDIRDDDIVSYGSLLEQALRNGLKRSPSDMPPGGQVEKKAKLSGSIGSVGGGNVTGSSVPPVLVAAAVTPPPTSAPQRSLPVAENNGSSGTGRSSSSGQVSVEDVAKTSLRELLHNKQIQDAKVAAMAQLQQSQQHYHGSAEPPSHNGSRSSSPSVNLRTLLETQTREALKMGQLGQHRSANPNDISCLPFPASASRSSVPQQAGMQNFPSNKHHLAAASQPMLYPHILNRSSSPGMMRDRSASDAGQMLNSTHTSSVHSSGMFKHKKLLEWTAADVRDWVQTLTYCSEFSDIFLQQSVDGVALTLLNETHLMKNFGMKLGPAIKLRCAVWEILGLCQAASAHPLPQMPLSMPHYVAQKQIPVGHCIPQHHNGGVLPK